MTGEDAISYNKKRIYVSHSPKGYGKTYFAGKDFKKGDTVMRGFGRITDHQTKQISIQIGLNAHYVPHRWAGSLLNHSCRPNCHVKSRRDGFPNWVASRRIKKGEEITYGYYMTELRWHSKANENTIECRCGHARCHKKIPTFSHLNKHAKRKMVKKGLVSRYLSLFHMNNP